MNLQFLNVKQYDVINNKIINMFKITVSQRNIPNRPILFIALCSLAARIYSCHEFSYI